MDNAIVVGGGLWQMDLVVFLQSKGMTVHVINPVESETTKKANYWIKADVRADPKTLYDLTKKLDPLLVMTDQSDIANLPAALLAEKNAAPNNIPATVRLFTDKSAMYVHAVNNGIPTPLSYIVDKESNLSDVLTGVLGAYPDGAFVKPIDNHSSRGVCMITSVGEGLAAFKYAKGQSYSGRVLVQGRVVGKEITVEGFMSQGKHHTLATSVKSHFRPAIASRLEYGSKLFNDQIQKDNDTFIEKSGLTYGPTHAEYIIDKAGQHWLIEIAARGGGSSISSVIVPHVCGMNVYEQWYNDLIGYDVRLFYDRDSNMALLKFYEYKPDDDVPTIDQLYEARNIVPGLYEINLNQAALKSRLPAVTDTDRHACAVILADPSWSHDDLLHAEATLDDFMACIQPQAAKVETDTDAK